MTLPARLRLWPTAEELSRMARHPAAYAPTAAEVLTSGPVPPPMIVMDEVERLLITDIVTNPDSDVRRLRYAGWVKGTDPERSAFIRGQITGFPLVKDDPIPQRWVQPFLPFSARDIVFRRGFAESMSLTGRSFISLSDGLFAATPLREVRLIAVNFLIPELVVCPNLRKLKRLDLRGNRIDEAGQSMLAACEWLRGVEVAM